MGWSLFSYHTFIQHLLLTGEHLEVFYLFIAMEQEGTLPCLVY